MSGKNSEKTILIIEPFYGGSHKQLIDVLQEYFTRHFQWVKIELFTLPAKKWHWRARTSAIHFSNVIPKSTKYTVLFCSDVLNLVELLGLRTDLSALHKIIYFHENQLVYPVQKYKDRDFQYGYNQILSALVADVVLFNSHFNYQSFVDNIDHYFKLQPDFRPKGLKDKIIPKSRVIYFPLHLSTDIKQISSKSSILHIIWPHRWEHDKNPELFFKTLFKLKENKYCFFVSILGESFSEIPDIFKRAQELISDHILNWGKLESKEDYFTCLKSGHVAVSTSNHEFFGVAMLEAVSCGCFPLVCNKLVYPELYPSMCLYNTPEQLYKKLKNFCKRPDLSETYLKKANIDLHKFGENYVMEQFTEVFFNHF